ncbi:restriction endonuclease [Niveibacterium sp. SC-1]|uniref:restriction endonuclease n=1 Tax=Niveibacterium sp. SC-1 TaxID=3135646 RepID=UPI00311FED7B
MLQKERESSWPERLAGLRWPAVALLAATVFVLGYLTLPFMAASMGAGASGLSNLRGLAVLVSFFLSSLALYRFLRERAAHAWFDAQTPLAAAPVLPVAPATRGRPLAGAIPAPEAHWTAELLENLGSGSLQAVCVALYRHKGFRAEPAPMGPDGSTEIRLWRDTIEGETWPYAIVRCRAWSEAVGEGQIRELLAVMAHERIPRAFFVAPRGFDEAARAFAHGNPLTLLDGRLLLAMLERLPAEERHAMIEVARKA